jgi:hypothetical protein
MRSASRLRPKPPEETNHGFPDEQANGRPGILRKLPWLKDLALIAAIPAVIVGSSMIRNVVGSPSQQGALSSGVLSPARDPGNAESLVGLPGEQMEGTVGSELLLGVRATGRRSLALADTPVYWLVASGEGTLSAHSGRTDAEGVARTTLLLPPRPGQVVVVGRVPGSNLPTVRFRVTVLPPMVAAEPTTPADTSGVAAALTPPDELAADTEVQTPPEAAPVGSAEAPVETEAQTSPGGTPAGSESESEDEPPPPVSVVRSGYSVGGNQVCALLRGRPRCRGASGRGPTRGGAATDFLALAAGVSHVCGLDGIGRAGCWGANDAGQLGDGSRSSRTTAERVISDLRFSALTAGLAHTCGVSGGGRAACWGRNLNGQLGNGTRDDRTSPRAVFGDVLFRSLSAGWHHTCGLSTDGRVYCWGLNDEGQLGDGSRLDRLVPTGVPGAFTSVSAGNAHTCGVSGGEVLCWGDNSFGQLGDGSLEDRTRPVRVQGLPGPPVRLATGAVHTCALLEGGQAFCWGQNLHGQLGDGTTQNQGTPTAVAGDLRFITLHAGGALTCGFSTDGSEYCWGLNQSGQLGDGTRTNRSTPTPVGG